MTKPVLLKLDDDLVAEIDHKRGDVPRTVWIVRACERMLSSGGRPARQTVDLTTPVTVNRDFTGPTRVAERLTESDTSVADPKPLSGMSTKPRLKTR
jgi:hypothetical protein